MFLRGIRLPPSPIDKTYRWLYPICMEAQMTKNKNLQAEYLAALATYQRTGDSLDLAHANNVRGELLSAAASALGSISTPKKAR